MAGKKLFEGHAFVSMNEVSMAGDGGRVVLHAIDAELPDGHAQVEVILNLRTDKAMEPYPETAKDRATRRFKITITEEGNLTDEQRGLIRR